MRVTKFVREAHRAAIIEQAGRLFRRRGIAGVAVADVTAAAGLTHGAFYGHFASKDALAAEAVRSSLFAGATAWQRRAERARQEGRDPLAAVVRAYLTEAHRDAPEFGCVLAALGPELARAGPPVADALRDGTQALLAVLGEIAAPEKALAILSTMTGGLVLARALAADPNASRAALDAAAQAALT
jgi:TetR/AcrR family transcriptional repressor of nem operon